MILMPTIEVLLFWGKVSTNFWPYGVQQEWCQCDKNESRISLSFRASSKGFYWAMWDETIWKNYFCPTSHYLCVCLFQLRDQINSDHRTRAMLDVSAYIHTNTHTRNPLVKDALYFIKVFDCFLVPLLYIEVHGCECKPQRWIWGQGWVSV